MQSASTASGSHAIEDALRETAATITSSDNYKRTRAEQRLNRLGDGVQKISQVVTLGGSLNSESTSDAFTVIKQRIDSFLDDSKAVMSVLDEIGKIHPFIQVAVSAFKVALNLEITRRGNDEKVLALKIQMKDMMTTLYALKNIDRDKSAVAELLTSRMIKVTQSIKLCAEVCEAYQRQKLVVKFFASHSWEGKFTDISLQFEENKAGLQSNLAVHTNRGVAAANEALVSIQADITHLMKMVFEQCRSSEEREVSAFVASKGGAEKVLKSDVLLAELLKLQRPREGQSTKAIPYRPTDEKQTVVDVRKDLAKDLDKVLEENRKTFDQKFEAQQAQISEVRDTVLKQGDRIINTMLSGPHERIVNKDMYLVWKENNWKTSVKAHHLVMALHDHFTQQRYDLAVSESNALDDIHGVITPSNGESDARKIEEVSDIANREIPHTHAGDQWALDYIGIHLVKPLIEAIDGDLSSFVTISEVNAFTAARPAEWSLPHWIAYWTVGFESTIRWYYNRIVALLAKIWDASKETLPVNRRIVNAFGQAEGVFPYIDSLLAGIQQYGSYEGTDRRFKLWSKKFRSYVDAEERRMDEVLDSVSYQIDDENTLTLVVGHLRPEQYILPVTFILLRRTLEVVELSSCNALDEYELDVIDTSFRTIFAASYDRIDTLKAINNLQNRDNYDPFKISYHGMYTYMLEDDPASSYWETDPSLILENTDHLELDPPTYDGQEEKLYYFAYNSPELSLDFAYQDPAFSFGEEQPSSASIIGHWGGTYSYDDGRPSDGLVSFTVEHIDDGHSIFGHGIDALGRFKIQGAFQHPTVAFTREYIEPSDGEKTSLRFTGEVDEDFQEMTGTWGALLDAVEDTERKVSTGANGSPELEEPVNADDDEDEANTGRDVESSEEGENKPDSAWEDAEDEEVAVEVEGEDEQDDEDEEFEEEEEEGEEESVVNLDEGSFNFKRKPRLYFLCRSQDAEIGNGKIRSLWKLVLNAALHIVRSRQLRWETLKERRDRRRVYMTLLAEKEENRGRLPLEKASQWNTVLGASNPEDLLFWRMLGIFYTSRTKIVHTIICSSCDKQSFEGCRYICLDCSDGNTHNILNFCQDCLDSVVPWEDEDGISREHLQSHSMLQLRMALPHHYEYAARERAKTCMAELAQYDSQETHVCVSCSGDITRPYWYCIDCEEDHTFVCYNCNAVVDKDQSWMFEYRPISEQPMDRHNWTHALILFPSSATAEMTLSVEERLSSIEQQFSSFSQAQEKACKGLEESLVLRMERMEGMMKDILDAIGITNRIK